MGEFSCNPKERLAHAVSRHYVGVRLQQGVPILDADWNELEDLRKHEMQSFVKSFIGDGVPSDSDGFRVSALDGGGINTIVLQVVSTTSNISTLEIDLSASTAASLLGFLVSNSTATNFENSPARLTGFHSEPFILEEGQTLTIVANGGVAETITFRSSDFADISQATATEVVAAINAAASQVVASAGNGNDLIIGGGDGMQESAGRLLVSGSEIINEFDLAYSSQPLYMNDALADKWNVDPLDELSEPTGDDRVDLVYIDVWEREVSSSEDNTIILAKVGVETTVRTRREWVVRIAPGQTELLAITTKPGHKYTALALINRKVSEEKAISGVNITDLRKRQLTLSELVISPILVKGALGLDKVNSGLFANMMRTTNRVYQDLLHSDYFLATNFSDISAIESVQVLAAFQDIRTFAERIRTEAQLKRLENETALELMRRLYELQRDFVYAIQPLAAATAQRAGTGLLMDLLETWLEGDGGAIPGLRSSVLPGESPNLGCAYDAQILINDEIGRRTGRLPQGLLFIQFVSGPIVSINPGSSYEFVYSILSQLNVDETIELTLTDSLGLFQFAFKDLDEDPNYPGDASHATILIVKDDTVNIAFDLTIPAGIPMGTQSRILLVARSQMNPDEVDFANVEINVIVGSMLSLPSPQLQLALTYPELNLATDTQPIGKTAEGNAVNFSIDISYLTPSTTTDEFQFSIDFIGNNTAFEVLGAGTLNPFLLPGSIQGDGTVVPIPVTIPIGAVDSATDGLTSLMVIRLAKTDIMLPEPFFRELIVQIVTDINA